MRFNVYFKHMENSPAVENYAREKLTDKIEKFLDEPVDTQVTFSVEHQKSIVNLHVVSGHNTEINLHTEGDSMYACIDEVVDKLDVQLRRLKEKTKNHRSDKSAIRAEMEAVAAIRATEAEAVDAGDIVSWEKKAAAKEGV